MCDFSLPRELISLHFDAFLKLIMSDKKWSKIMLCTTMHIINVELAPAIEDKLHSIHCDLEDVL